jgi:hypothetical protein
MATKYLGPSPKLRATDQNGTPLVGGFVYAYEAGTTTPITTYSNSAGTANAWPITLDSRGECSLYLTPGIKCDLRVTDANGVLQYTQTRESAPVTPSSYFAGLMVATTQSSLFTTIVAPSGTFTGNLDFEAAFNYAVPVSLTSSASTPIGAAASNTVTIDPEPTSYFDAAKKSSIFTLTNSDKLATNTGPNLTWGVVLGVTGKSSGKWYFEILPSNSGAGNMMFGIAKSNATLTTYLGFDANGWTCVYNTGTGNFVKNYNNNVTTTLNVLSLGTAVIGIALDLDAGEVRAYQNNTSVKTAGAAIYTGLSGTFYPAFSSAQQNDFGTLRLLLSEFSYTPPVGYTAWGA